MRRGGRASRLRRRELLQLMLGGTLGAQLAACDRPPPQRALPGILGGQAMATGHRLRQPPLRDGDLPARIDREVPVLIVGAGPAGLSAAYHLHRAGQTRLAVLDLEGSAGGTARGERSAVTPFPLGAHYLTCPSPDNRPLCELLREMNVIKLDGDGLPRGRAPYLVNEPKERHFYRGFFYPGLYRFAGAGAQDLAQLARFQGHVEALAQLRDGRGSRAFALPFSHSSTDAEWTQLDRLSAGDYLRAQDFTSERLLWLCNYACRDDFGLTLADTSAWAMLHYFASRAGDEAGDMGEVLTWPEGNAALIAHLGRKLGDQLHTGSLVTDILERDRGVSVFAQRADGHLLHYRAQRVIVATPQFIAQRIVRGLRDGARNGPAPAYGAWFVANLHLRDRPEQRGSEQSWDTVLTESPSLGYICATHQRGRGYGRTVWTYYMPMTDHDPAAGRQRLLGLELNEIQEVVLSDLERAHPDLRAQVERLDVFRWGHAMVQPRVGALFDNARTRARQALGRIHFAHSDLSSLALFEEAFDHGLRAAQEVVAALRAEEGA